MVNNSITIFRSLFLIFLSWILSFCILKLAYHQKNLFGITIGWMIGYYGLYVLSNYLKRFYGFGWIHYIISMPIALFIILFNIFQPIVTIFISYSFIFILVSASTIYLIQLITSELPSLELFFYITITLTSILLTIMGDIIVHFFHHTQSHNNPNFYYSQSQKILNQEKIRIVLYALYFLVLFLGTIASLNKLKFFETINIELVLLPALASYLAFDSMIKAYYEHSIKK